MRRSKAEIYLHFVWATKNRQPMLTPEIERSVYRCIESEAKDLKVIVLAIGGISDHVHLLVRMPTSVCASVLMKQVKGVSTTFVRDQLQPKTPFCWQEGYGVFSVSRSHVDKVTSYVINQKTHHADNKLWDEWEQSDEEVLAPPNVEGE